MARANQTWGEQRIAAELLLSATIVPVRHPQQETESGRLVATHVRRGTAADGSQRSTSGRWLRDPDLRTLQARQRALERPPRQRAAGPVRRRQRVGGLLSYYYRDAA